MRHMAMDRAWGEAHRLGNRSLLLVVVVMALAGDIMVTQAAAQAQRIVGDLGLVGPAFLQMLVRELAPVIVALMVAARYGAGAAAEIGTMAVTDQLDALRLAGVDPIDELVIPRIFAGLLGMLPLVIAGAAVALGTGAVAAHTRFDIGWDTYFSLRWVTVADVVIGAVKAVAFGAAVPAVAAYVGLHAEGGAPGVGRAATRTVVVGSMVVLLLDLLIGATGHMIVQGLG